MQAPTTEEPRAEPARSRWNLLRKLFGTHEERWEAVLPLAILVGLASGLAGVGLRSAVHALFHAFEGLREQGLAGVLLPAAGAGAGVLIVAALFREPPGHGVPDVIRAVCRRGGRMRARSTLSRWLGSMVNVSAGGSAGLEGPIVFSAAALGSSIGGLFKVDERMRSVLLACGVAGGISGVFNAPMTGLVFATEVVLAEWTAFSIVPVAVASVAGTELSRRFLGNESPFLHPAFVMGSWDLVACVGLGVAAGVASVGLARTIRAFDGLRERFLPRRFAAPVLFGLGVGLIGLVAPAAIGEGYEPAQLAIQGDLAGGAGLLLLLALAKILTTGLTLGSGAPGGVFAPCLVIGSFLGASYAKLMNLVLPQAPLGHEGSYALVGMSGLVAGVMQAPLTGIFLVMEVTRGYDVILPLMIVSVVSLLVARRFETYSLYTLDLARHGELLRPGTDRRILADVALRETLDAEVVPIGEDMTLAEFAQVARRTRRNHFPVLRGEDDELVGMLDFGAVRELVLDPELARVTLVGTVMDTDLPRVPLDANLSEALEVFERTGAWVLPTVDAEGHFAGLISKSTLFDRYRKELSVQRTA